MGNQETPLGERHINGANGRVANLKVDFDAIVIGAGFGGLRMMYELQKQGISGKLFESGSGVGGTWYWNRYPGARTDSESWVYIFTFLEQLNLDWSWKERYPSQVEVEQYLNKVVDHLGIRKDIQLNTKVTAASRDESSNIWRVTTAQGQEYTCRFLVSATGPLATPIKPPYPGLESFKGEWYQTGIWPKDKVQFTGKRVAIIGTGATGVQLLPVIAHTAKHVTVFQRTPNYVIPGRNHTLIDEQMDEIKANYQNVFTRARSQVYGFDITDATLKIDDLGSDAEIQQVLEAGWEKGGFRYIFETFSDVVLSPKSNEAMSEFVRRKIRAIVKDKEVADLLCPHYPIVSKRPPVGHFYYEAFNRDNVNLVDIKSDPIQEITSAGLRTGGREFEFDMIIFAIGFDAITGTLAQIALRGTEQQLLSDVLQEKLQTNYGITVAGFPNFFMIFGPQAPFANGPLVIDNTADWIGKTMSYMKANGYNRIEATKQAAEQWSDHVNLVFNSTVIAQSAKDTNSWLVGANVGSKQKQTLFYLGGVPAYFAAVKKELEDQYPGHKFSTVA